MNHLKYQIVGILAAVAVLVFSPLPARAGTLFFEDYQDGKFGNVFVRNQSPGAGYPSLCCDHSAQAVTAPGRSGKAVKFTLRSKDEGYEYGNWKDPYIRAELEKTKVARLGDKRWYGLSVYIDPAYADRSKDPNGTIVSQWYTDKDSCDQRKSPRLSIQVTRDGRWLVRNHSDAKACTTSTSDNRRNWDVGPVQKGVWVDWVVYAKWSYKSDGVLKVWKDGKLVVEHNGPNTYNDEKEEVWKWGIYKSHWRKELPPADTLIVYHDNVSIGDANSSYTEVAPRGSQPTPQPTPLSTPVNLRIME